MKRFYSLICYSLLISTVIACKKETEVKQEISSTIPFEEIPFDVPSITNELTFKTYKTVTLYASLDTLNSQTKTIENSGSERLFWLKEFENYYQVSYFKYGNNTESYLGYVNKKDFNKKDENSLEFKNLNEIRYSNLNGVYNDQLKSFEAYGNVKLIDFDLYKSLKNKLYTPIITQTKDVSFDETNQIYSFTTNSGEIQEVIKIDNEEGVNLTNDLKGFVSILQSFLFETREDDNTHYTFYSKKSSKASPQHTKTIPVYNKNNQLLAQLYDDDDVGSLFIIQSINNSLHLTEKLLVNFTNFKIKPNSLFWVANNTIVAEIFNGIEESSSSYVLIELKI